MRRRTHRQRIFHVRSKRDVAMLSVTGESYMRRIKPAPIRNKIDLADPRQVRLLKKRLGISDDDLQRLVGKVGNSIAAVSKEAELAKAAPLLATLPVVTTPSATKSEVAASL
jgi:Protein of unknown function (DUF3606)